MAAKRKKPERRKPNTGYVTATKTGKFKAHFPRSDGTGYHVRTCDTRPAAEAWLGQQVGRATKRYDVAGAHLPAEVWFARFLEHIAQEAREQGAPLKAKTLSDYAFKLSYPQAYIRGRAIGDILPDHIDDVLTNLSKDLAPNTMKQIRRLLWQAFEEAVLRRYIEFNPVRKPRRRRKATVRRPVYRLSVDQAHRLLAIVDPPFRLALWLMLTLGLREGEIVGLRREDIDLEAGTISIQQQITTLDGRKHKETPKSDYSVRTLPVALSLIPLIAAQLLENRFKPNDQGMLFPGRDGGPMHPSTLLHTLKRALAQAELPSHVTIHHIRHTCGQLYTMVKAPLDPIVQTIFGHSPRTVTGHYAPPPLETLRPWVNAVYDALATNLTLPPTRLSTPQAAKLLNISIYGVWAAIEAGTIKAEKIGRQWFIAPEEIDAYKHYQKNWRKKNRA